MKTLFLCTDMDRTLIPNGVQDESPRVRELFTRFVRRTDVSLAYVTGRSLELVLSGMVEYALPTPDFIIADVGTSIYTLDKGVWCPWQPWTDHLAQDWPGISGAVVHALLSDLSQLTLQTPENQGHHKVSYCVDLVHDQEALFAEIGNRLHERGIVHRVIWSLNEDRSVGLLDVVPERAGKLHALEFLLNGAHINAEQAMFAGDSGNDLDVLLSPLHTVLVANGEPHVMDAVAKAQPENTYIAEGGFLGLNGCYAAGILEGVAHFCPQYIPVLRELKPKPFSLEDFEDSFEFLDHWDYAYA